MNSMKTHMTFQSWIIPATLLFIFSVFFIPSCGDVASEINGVDKILGVEEDDPVKEDDNEDEEENAQLLRGTFLDAAVGGVTFTGNGASGTTDSNGQFFYTPGSQVTFSIGSVTLGTITGTSTVTPINVVGATDESDQRVINMLRFLQTLDNDGDPNNGITITSSTRAAATSAVNFDQTPGSFTNDTATVVSNLGATTTANTSSLVSSTAALEHFQVTLSANNIATVTVSSDSKTLYDDFSSGSISSSLWDSASWGTNSLSVE
ncbi:MAG: hypothetical protein HQM14_21940, partial [SAR324 cluster bacterium]|nr:hypothetical protein [SAR324 cluster bacterium]